MKRTIVYLVIIAAILMSAPTETWAQAPATNIVHVTMLKTKWPEKGTASARDSLIAIYNANVVQKNGNILSHREYAHYFTSSSTDYMIVEEYKDMASLEMGFTISEDLEKKAWPDEAKRKAFMDAMGAYFETWHGDAIYHVNPKLSKN